MAIPADVASSFQLPRLIETLGAKARLDKNLAQECNETPAVNESQKPVVQTEWPLAPSFWSTER